MTNDCRGKVEMKVSIKQHFCSESVLDTCNYLLAYNTTSPNFYIIDKCSDCTNGERWISFTLMSGVDTKHVVTVCGTGHH